MWLVLLNTLLPAIGAILWFWGGCGERCHPGLPPLNKSWRRHVWPTIAGLIIWVNGFGLLKAVLVAASMVLVNSLGYGQNKPWWYRVLVALALGAPFMFLYMAPWPLLTLAVFIPLYVISLRHNWMAWNVVEAANGATQGGILLTIVTILWTMHLFFGA